MLPANVSGADCWLASFSTKKRIEDGEWPYDCLRLGGQVPLVSSILFALARKKSRIGLAVGHSTRAITNNL
jgi:hypothetical protein